MHNNIIYNRFKFFYKLIVLFLFGLSLISLSSCVDSFGTDPNVKITPLDRNTSSDSVKKYLNLIPDWKIIEMYEDNSQVGNYMIWGDNNSQFNYNTLKIDTSNNRLVIWLNIDVENTTPDNMIAGRQDRIVSFRMKLDSIDITTDSQNKIIDENGYPKGIFVELQVKSITENKRYVLTNEDFASKIYIQRDSNNAYSGGVHISLIPYFPYQTFGFQTNFTAKIKN